MGFCLCGLCNLKYLPTPESVWAWVCLHHFPRRCLAILVEKNPGENAQGGASDCGTLSLELRLLDKGRKTKVLILAATVCFRSARASSKDFCALTYAIFPITLLSLSSHCKDEETEALRSRAQAVSGRAMTWTWTVAPEWVLLAPTFHFSHAHSFPPRVCFPSPVSSCSPHPHTGSGSQVPCEIALPQEDLRPHPSSSHQHT